MLSNPNNLDLSHLPIHLLDYLNKNNIEVKTIDKNYNINCIGCDECTWCVGATNCEWCIYPEDCKECGKCVYSEEYKKYLQEDNNVNNN